MRLEHLVHTLQCSQPLRTSWLVVSHQDAERTDVSINRPASDELIRIKYSRSEEVAARQDIRA